MKNDSLKRSAFVYPRFKPDKGKNSNPYIQNVCNALGSELTIRNSDDYTYFETKDILKHWNADFFFFNWIEEIYRFRGGKVRVLLFLFVLQLLKLRKKKIVWTLHNKESHHRKSKWRRFMVKQMINDSDLIITHSEEGIEYIADRYPQMKHKVKYICHPTRKLTFETKKESIVYDVLIWGAITPYKGIFEFLKTVKENESCKDIRIVIVGKCFDEEYLNKIESVLTKNTTFINDFLSIEDIATMAQASSAIAFTYQAESVLSSGSLMDSIAMKRPIIGPNIGAFADLSKEGLVHTYDNKNQLLKIVKTGTMLKEEHSESKINAFLKENDWNRYAEKVLRILY